MAKRKKRPSVRPPDVKQAVALQYDPMSEGAPKVTAKGAGEFATKIIEVAKEHKIPVREDKNLVQVLSTLELNQEIPANVYRAVAQILAFIYRASHRPLG